MHSPIMSTKATEAMRLNEGSLIFLQRGRLVYRPEADVGGIDFLLASPKDITHKCQQNSGAFVSSAFVSFG